MPNGSKFRMIENVDVGEKSMLGKKGGVKKYFNSFRHCDDLITKKMPEFFDDSSRQKENRVEI